MKQVYTTVSSKVTRECKTTDPSSQEFCPPKQAAYLIHWIAFPRLFKVAKTNGV